MGGLMQVRETNPLANGASVSSPVRLELSKSLSANQTLDSAAGYIGGKFNDRGVQVAWWQEQLNKWMDANGMSEFKVDVNGKWDGKTEEAVRIFQQANGLDDDGIIGPRTFRKMAQHLTKEDPTYLSRSVGVEMISDEEFKKIVGSSNLTLRKYYKDMFHGVEKFKFDGSDPFEASLAHTLKFEGGYAFNPKDRGGETNFGITQNTYNSWRKSHGLEKGSVKNITQQEAKDIYYNDYWLESNCDKLPPEIAARHFDAAVNHGVGGASRLMQSALRETGMHVDQLQALNPDQQKQFVDVYLNSREGLYKRIIAKDSSQKTFAKGWQNRVDAQRPDDTSVA